MKKFILALCFLLLTSTAFARQYYVFIENLGTQKGEVEYVKPVESHTVSLSERTKYIIIKTDLTDKEARILTKVHTLGRTVTETLDIEKVDYDVFFEQYSQDEEDFIVLNKEDKGSYWEVQFKYKQQVPTTKKSYVVDVGLLKNIDDEEELDSETVDSLFKHRVNPSLSVRNSASLSN